MATSKKQGSNEAAWNQILEDNKSILEDIHNNGVYDISSTSIKEYREPRLMTKFDTSASVSSPLKVNDLNVLPISRREYALGQFQLYQEFPDTSQLKPSHITLPELETLRVDDLTSEANAINALKISGTLEEFLGVEGLYETFNGRMGSGDFKFRVDCKNDRTAEIDVHGAQLEIDGGFESDDYVVIMEAKNVLHDDFNIRQLYYPFRKYYATVNKPIRLVFSQYTNSTYNLFEYQFDDPLEFNSIALIKMQSYTFEDDSITWSDLDAVWRKTKPTQDDDHSSTSVPFIQADRIDRVISLLERLFGAPNYELATDEITDFMGLTPRQTSYYSAAGEYLGLFDRENRNKVQLSQEGIKVAKQHRKERLLSIVGLMFDHQIFHELYQGLEQNGVPTRQIVTQRILDMHICKMKSTADRRAQTVISWLKWITSLVD